MAMWEGRNRNSNGHRAHCFGNDCKPIHDGNAEKITRFSVDPSDE